MSTLDKLKSFADAREEDHIIIRDGLTYEDARKTVEMLRKVVRARDVAERKLERIAQVCAEASALALGGGEVVKRVRDAMGQHPSGIPFEVDDLAAASVLSKVRSLLYVLLLKANGIPESPDTKPLRMPRTDDPALITLEREREAGKRSGFLFAAKWLREALGIPVEECRRILDEVEEA